MIAGGVRGWRCGVVRGGAVEASGGASGRRGCSCDGGERRRRRVVADAGASQGVLQEMTETGHVDGPRLGCRSAVMVEVVMVRAVHQTALDLPPVRLPLALERVAPAACSGGGGIIIKRPVTKEKKKMGTIKVVLVRLVLEGGARADYVGGLGGGSSGCAGQCASAAIKCWLVIIIRS